MICVLQITWLLLVMFLNGCHVSVKRKKFWLWFPKIVEELGATIPKRGKHDNAKNWCQHGSHFITGNTFSWSSILQNAMNPYKPSGVNFVLYPNFVNPCHSGQTTSTPKQDQDNWPASTSASEWPGGWHFLPQSAVFNAMIWDDMTDMSQGLDWVVFLTAHLTPSL